MNGGAMDFRGRNNIVNRMRLVGNGGFVAVTGPTANVNVTDYLIWTGSNCGFTSYNVGSNLFIISLISSRVIT
jgi:hypothetical protein